MIALDELAGVGDPTLGEWHEWTGKAYHVRRRLTPEEQQSVGPVVDVRRTEEGFGRARALSVACPHMANFAAREAHESL